MAIKKKATFYLRSDKNLYDCRPRIWVSADAIIPYLRNSQGAELCNYDIELAFGKRVLSMVEKQIPNPTVLTDDTIGRLIKVTGELTFEIVEE